MDRPYAQQLLDKQQSLAHYLAPWPEIHYLEPVPSPPFGARNRSKMVVSGRPNRLLLGIINADGMGQDLCGCPLYSTSMQSLLLVIRDWLNSTGIAPYDIKTRRGELKYVLLNENHQLRYMLRLVLKSPDDIPLLKRHLPRLRNLAPQIDIVSVNLQRVAMAILEGPEEILLTEDQWLPQKLGEITLYQRPKGFFQTNTAIAEKLYRSAAQWLTDCPGEQLWDLYCGAGGFGLSCLQSGQWLTGIEIEAEAIRCAQRSADEMGLSRQCHFRALDINAVRFSDDVKPPDTVIVNPPRRGLGEGLCQLLIQWQPLHVLYSSCNANTLALDLARLTAYSPVKVQLFDMFPHTGHYEVLCLLKRLT